MEINIEGTRGAIMCYKQRWMMELYTYSPVYEEISVRKAISYFLHPKTTTKDSSLKRYMYDLEENVKKGNLFYFIREGGDDWDMHDEKYYDQKKNDVEFLFDVAHEGKWLDFVPPNFMNEED